MSSRAPRSSARGRRIWALVGVLLFVSSATASACPLCYEAAKQSMTIGLKLDMSEDAVLAVALPDGSRYHVVAVIKGNDVGDIPADKISRMTLGEILPAQLDHLLEVTHVRQGTTTRSARFAPIFDAAGVALSDADIRAMMNALMATRLSRSEPPEQPAPACPLPDWDDSSGLTHLTSPTRENP